MQQKIIARLAVACFAILAMLALTAGANAADHVKIGVVKVAANGPNFIAKDKGYLAAEGIDAEIIAFNSAEPVTLAIVSGDVDFGATGPGAAFYNLAGQNKVRIVSGLARDVPGFPVFAFIVSNQAYASGFTSYAALGGHSVSTTQIGAPSHYAINLLEQKFNTDPRTVRVVALQSLPNQISATAGGQVDAGVVLATIATPAINRGALKLLGYVGDTVSIQTGALFTSAKHADQDQESGDALPARLSQGRARLSQRLHRAGRETPRRSRRRRDPGDHRQICRANSRAASRGDFLYRCGATLDVNDILRQLAWFQAQGMVKPNVRGDQVYDKRYVVPLATR